MLMKYAKLVSQHFGIKACTYNLHLLCCRYVSTLDNFSNFPAPVKALMHIQPCGVYKYLRC